MPCRKELEREARIILQIMLKSKHHIKKLPLGEVALYRDKFDQKIFVKKLPVKLIEFMHENSWLELDVGIYKSTEVGHNWLAEFLYFLDLKPTAETNMDDVQNIVAPYVNAQKSLVEMGEMSLHMNDVQHSPIIKLYNRQRNIAHKYLNAIHVEAGQKLFDYFVTANLEPNVTMDWERLKSVKQSHHTGQSGNDFSEQTYLARQQLYDCLKYTGPEFAAVLVEICLFGNGLEATERTMNWPARSGKLLLTMALDRLAEHLGIFRQLREPNKYLAWAKQSDQPDRAINR